jgi:hypothetical protein
MIDPIIIPTDGMGCGSSSFTGKYSIKQLCELFVQNVGQQGFRQGCIQRTFFSWWLSFVHVCLFGFFLPLNIHFS